MSAKQIKASKNVPNGRFHHKAKVNEEAELNDQMLDQLTPTPTTQPVLEGYVNKQCDRIQFKNPSFIALKKYAAEYCSIHLKNPDQKKVPNLVLRYEDVNQLGQRTTNMVPLKYDFLINPQIDNIRNLSIGLDWLQATGHIVQSEVMVETKAAEQAWIPIKQEST